MVDIYTVSTQRISTQRSYLHSVYLHSTHQASSSPLCCKTLHGLPHLTTPLTHWASQYAPIIWSKSFILLGFYILNWVKWPKENQRIQFLQEADIWKIFASHLWLQQPEGAGSGLVVCFIFCLFELFSVHWISAWKNCKYWFLCLGTGTHCYAAVVVVWCTAQSALVL